jgi:hypothetical protein
MRPLSALLALAPDHDHTVKDGQAVATRALNINGTGSDYQAIGDIQNVVVDAGKSQVSKDRVGENLNNRAHTPHHRLRSWKYRYEAVPALLPGRADRTTR